MLNYKIMDAHAHIFPEKIAEKAINTIGDYYGTSMIGNGTVSDLLKKGKKAGVSKYLVHSTATSPDQVKPINDFIFHTISKNKSFEGFGALHPDMDDIEKEVYRMISFGIKGVKMHPEFQNFYIDQESMLPIYSAIEGKLPLLIHMGDEKRTTSSPIRLSKILDKFPRLSVIAAHLGGYSMWNQAMEYLIGRDLYLDTSSSLMFLDSSEATRIIKSHGVNRVVFGTDYPMWSHKEELERFLKLDLSYEEQKLILWDNISNLLSLYHNL